ncbi:MAG: hypothetical protein HGA49_01890 [Eubacteriaceae bacterium]|nr:hypothetical protein [Eubacteriaceae bacterium]
MKWINKFMAGRYGGDQLSTILLVLSVILSLAGQFASIGVLITISYIPLAAAVFRIFSKNTEKRRMENYKFAMLVSPIYSKFNKTKNRIRDSKTYKYFKCPDCMTMMRIPKGKNKVLVTCPKCKKRFAKST